jgi:hypothetical protein
MPKHAKLKIMLKVCQSTNDPEDPEALKAEEVIIP